MTQLLVYLLALPLLALLAYAPGWVLQCRWLHVGELAEFAVPVRFALGLGFWMLAAFALASVGAYDRLGMTVVLVSVVGLVLWQLRSRGEPPRPPAGPSAWRQDLPWHLLPALALLVTLALLFLRASSPGISWDADTYHLTIPRIYLDNGGFTVLPFNVYSNWPLGPQLLYGLVLELFGGDPVPAKLVHFGFGVLVLVTVVAAVRRWAPASMRIPLAWLAAALFLANGVVQFEFHAAYVDLAYAFFFLVALLLACVAATEDGKTGRDPNSLLLLSGLVAGVLTGVKLTGIVGAACVALVYLFTAQAPWRDRLHSLVLRFAVPVAVLWSPWLVKSAWATGNPIYPFVWGGPNWSARLSEQFSAWQQGIGMGRDLLDYVLLPVRVILEGGEGYARFDGTFSTLWLVLVPLVLLAAFRSRSQRAPIRACVLAAGLYFVAWAVSSQQARFLIPLLPPLALAAGLSVGTLLQGLSERVGLVVNAGTVLAASLLILSAGLPQVPAARQIVDGYAKHGAELRQRAVPPHLAYINQNLPADARILLLNTNHGFHCHRTFYADSFFEASQVGDWLRGAATPEELRGRLAEYGITHVLVVGRDWGIDYPPSLGEVLASPRWGRVVIGSLQGNLALVELAPERSDSAGRPTD